MKKGIIVLLICFFSNMPIANAQSNTINIVLENTEVLPQESIFVHFNTSLFLAGESLYYKIYCLNKDTNKLSTISRIAYVELIGEDHEVVFKHKVKLESGIGFGDLTIPVSVNSGNYKLIVYTQWMKNQGIDSFFKSDISIINPFQSNQQTILVDNDLNQSKNTNELLDVSSGKEILKTVSSQFLEIETKQKTAQKREEVSLTLRNKTPENLDGNYSISVRKVDAMDRLASKVPSANAFISQSDNRKHSLKNINYLPELRGELISGTLLQVSDNKPAANQKVVISIQQHDFILKVSNTNQKGVFYFNLNEDYDNENAILQVLGRDNKDYKITLNEHASVDYNNLDFGTFKISSNYKSDLEQRSIYNQIENGYFDLKLNRLMPIDTIQPFFGNYFATYFLDDYTRFSKIGETFVEVIKHSYIKRDNNKKLNFYVRSLDPYEQFEKPAGVIVDGILLQHFDELLTYDSRRIKRISIARTETNFVISSKVFGGYIVIETIDGKFCDELKKDNLTEVTLFKPQPKKTYYKKVYTSDNTFSRIPDYRNQLLWEPNINMRNKEMIFNFFTSDNKGEYEICIEGFTENGNPVSIRDFVIVE